MITWAMVCALAPALSTVTLEAQTEILADVEREVAPSKWAGAVDAGRLALARHKGVLALAAASSGTGGGTVIGPVSSETVGPVTRTFAVSSSTGGSASSGGTLDATAWGQEYKRLRKMLPARFGNVI